VNRIAGSITLLAAAVLFGCGAIAEALFAAGKVNRSPVGGLSMFGGVVVGLIGLPMLFSRDSTAPPDR
jgi:small neutral amino acid transporter SnatA (MarC family)